MLSLSIIYPLNLLDEPVVGVFTRRSREVDARPLAKQANIFNAVDVAIVGRRDVWTYFFQGAEGQEVFRRAKEVSRSQVVMGAEASILGHEVGSILLDSVVDITDIKKESLGGWKNRRRRRKKVVYGRNGESLHGRLEGNDVV